MIIHTPDLLDMVAKAIAQEEYVYLVESNPSSKPVECPDWDSLCECNMRGIGADCLCERDEYYGTKYNFLRYAYVALEAALPVIEQKIRESAATDIQRARISTDEPTDRLHNAVLELAATLVLNGKTP